MYVYFIFFVLESDVLRQGAYQAHNVSHLWYKEKMSREDGKIKETKKSNLFFECIIF